MKYFLAFLLICFAGGILFYRVSTRKRYLALFFLCMALAIAYFFFNKL